PLTLGREGILRSLTLAARGAEQPRPQGAANVSNLPRPGPQNSKKWCALRTLQTSDAYMLQFLYKQIKFLLDGLRRSFAGFLTLEM
ncbi:MAG: hypothetical protein V1816_27200, partial [Pseudomonadota bacterium]